MEVISFKDVPLSVVVVMIVVFFVICISILFKIRSEEKKLKEAVLPFAKFVKQGYEDFFKDVPKEKRPDIFVFFETNRDKFIINYLEFSPMSDYKILEKVLRSI